MARSVRGARFGGVLSLVPTSTELGISDLSRRSRLLTRRCSRLPRGQVSLKPMRFRRWGDSMRKRLTFLAAGVALFGAASVQGAVTPFTGALTIQLGASPS